MSEEKCRTKNRVLRNLSINWIFFWRLSIQNHSKPSITDKRRNRAKWLTWNLKVFLKVYPKVFLKYRWNYKTRRRFIKQQDSVECVVNSFLANIPILHPLKTPEKERRISYTNAFQTGFYMKRFSGVFRGCKIGKLARNRLSRLVNV